MRQFLEHVTGLSIYPLFSFVLFSLFFIAATVHALFLSKGLVDDMKNLPLTNDEAPNTFNEPKTNS